MDSHWLRWWPRFVDTTEGAGLLSIWIGMAAGYVVTTVLSLTSVLRLDWELAAQKSQRQAEATHLLEAVGDA